MDGNCIIRKLRLPSCDEHRLIFFPSDKAQHGPAAAIGAPYVYSYHKDDVRGLYAAVRAARDYPIER